MAPSTCSRHSESLSSFVPFPLIKLPPELRRLIWKLTLPGPQIHKAASRPCFTGEKALATHIRSPRTPVALSICQESRAVACETLTQFPRCQCDGPRSLSYFNPKEDILHVDLRYPSNARAAIWVDFRQISVVAEPIGGNRLNRVLHMLSCRPLVSQLYITDLEAAEEMTAIVRLKRDLKPRWILRPDMLANKTNCVAITEFEVVGDKEKTDQRLVEDITSHLTEKDRGLRVDLASAKVCCTC